MDSIITNAIRLWQWMAVAALVPLVLLGLIRIALWLCRLVPPVGRALGGVALRLRAFYDRFTLSAYAALGSFILWPVLIVALPVVGVTWLLLRGLVPDTPRVAVDGAAPAADASVPWTRLDWPLRVVTITALAQLLATAALLWVVKVPSSPVTLGTIGGAAVHIDRLIVWTTAVSLPVAFGLLLSGAWAHPLSQALVLAVFAVASRPIAWQGVAMYTWLVLVIVGAAGVVWTFARGPRGRSHSPRRFVVRALVLALVGAAYQGLTAQTLAGGVDAYARYLDRLVSELAFFLTPVLFLAGTDWVEISARGTDWFASRRLWRRTRAPGGRERAPGAAAALFAIATGMLSTAVALDFGDIDATGLRSLVVTAGASGAFILVFLAAAVVFDWGGGVAGRVGLGLGLLLIVGFGFGLVWLMVATEWRIAATAVAAASIGVLVPWLRRGGARVWTNANVPMAAVVVFAVVMAGSRETVVMVRAAYEIPPRQQAISFRVQPIESPTGVVTLAVPDHWSESARRSALQYAEGPDPYAGGAVVVGFVERERVGAAGLADIEPWVDAMLPDEFPAVDLEFEADVPATVVWRLSRSVLMREDRRYAVDVYDHARGPEHWLLVFVYGERYERYFAPTFARVLTSWRFDETATAPPTVDPPDLRRRIGSVSGFGFLPLLFAPVGYVLLLRKSPEASVGSPRDHAALLAVTVAATATFFLPETSLVEFWRGSGSSVNPFATLQLTLAAISLGLVVSGAVTRQLHRWRSSVSQLGQLNVAVLLVALVYEVYGQAILLSSIRVESEVTIFLIALALDLVTSGREITSVDGPVFPRPARLLVYLGYMMIVSTVALFIATQTFVSNGEPVPKLIESEDIVRQGLVWLGAPLLLLRAALRLSSAVRRDRRRSRSHALGRVSADTIEE